MKKYLLLLIIVAAPLLFYCSSGSVGDDSVYTGVLEVDAIADDELFTLNNVDCGIELDEANSTMNLVMYDVKFAEKMPIKITLTVKDIPCVISEESVRFSFEGYKEPFWGIMQMPAYAFSKIEGVVSDNALSFSATCTKGDFSFTTY